MTSHQDSLVYTWLKTIQHRNKICNIYHKIKYLHYRNGDSISNIDSSAEMISYISHKRKDYVSRFLFTIFSGIFFGLILVFIHYVITTYIFKISAFQNHYNGLSIQQILSDCYHNGIEECFSIYEKMFISTRLLFLLLIILGIFLFMNILYYSRKLDHARDMIEEIETFPKIKTD